MRRLLHIILLSLCLPAYSATRSVQRPRPIHHEHIFEVGLHGGVAGWHADLQYIAASAGLNAGGHIYYDYLTDYVIGFRTGVTLDYHAIGLSRSGYEDSYSTLDVDNQRMEIDYTIHSLSERYTTWRAAIPVQLAWRYEQFVLYTGAKAVFPLSCQRRQRVDNAALSVYYPMYDNRIEDSYPLAASKDFSMTDASTISQTTVQWWLSLELSYTIPLQLLSRKSRANIMVGLYFNYCLTRQSPTHSDAKSMIMLSDTRDGFPLQRLLTPVINSNRQGLPLVNTYNPYDVGITISYAISSYKPTQRKYVRRCTCAR